MEYNKEDLLWEAVRRNQDYKKFYNNELEKQRPLCRDIIKNKRLQIFPVSTRWQISNLPDPSLSITDIKAQMASQDPILSHPFVHLFQGQKRPVIHHEVPDSPYNVSENIKGKYNLFELEGNKNILCIEKTALINNPYDEKVHRLLISIDPTCSDEITIREIKKMKSDAIKKLTKLKEKNPSEHRRLYGLVTVKNGYSINEEKIDYYIGWFKKYDDVIMTFIEKKGEDNILVQEGARVVPDYFSVQEVAPKGTKGKHFESTVRAIREGYLGAIKLIQKAPNIYFHSPQKKQKQH